MGKGSSKEFFEGLENKDWKIFEKTKPEALQFLKLWVKQYGFSGKLQTVELKSLQTKIRMACKDKKR